NILTEHRENLDTISDILVRRETIEKHQFEGLLNGRTEADVFGPDEVPTRTPQLPPAASAPVPERPREAPRPLPRPGLAGGTTELRSSDPEQPELT
ncbi:MAG TPA: cell division protein FtsH, partial [Solirubrobacteraceae bacterium]|nr:cell division protein FtsH [Solirubrobacteraceae bacterium]